MWRCPALPIPRLLLGLLWFAYYLDAAGKGREATAENVGSLSEAGGVSRGVSEASEDGTHRGPTFKDAGTNGEMLKTWR